MGWPMDRDDLRHTGSPSALPPSAGRLDPAAMNDLSTDALHDALGDAEALLTANGFELDELPSAAKLALAVTGHPVELVTMRHEAYSTVVNGADRVFVRRGTPIVRARWLALHELCEVHYRRTGYSGEDVEQRCNAMASALAAPRLAVRAAVRAHGHAVHALAAALKTPQAATVLRLAEVVGRPCALLRSAGPIVRGDWHPWPPDAAGFKRWLASKDRPSNVHPLRIVDEGPVRWALMAA